MTSRRGTVRGYLRKDMGEPYAASVRIGTWNLEGRWSPEHERVLLDLACDVWLLTEIRSETCLADYTQHLSSVLMGKTKHWAGILSRWPTLPVVDPHPATVAADFGGYRYCCSVLPWPLWGGMDPWRGVDHATRMASTLDAITPTLAGRRVVWGGDWNQPLVGNLAGFNRRAQDSLLAVVDSLDLMVPTRDLLARNGVQASIDHIAVPVGWGLTDMGRTQVSNRLSDHDVYWLEGE